MFAHPNPYRVFFYLALLALALGLTFAVTAAGGYGERLSNGNFEEGFGANGVALNWVGFENGGNAFYHFQDDTAPAFAFNGKHSQLIQISTMPYYVVEPERYAGIYQTIAVVAGTPYTLTLHGMLRVLPTDPDMNNWAYVVQWGIDPFGGTDWGAVDWKTLPWQDTYDWQRPGPLSHFTTTFTAPTNKITLFIRVLKKFATYGRDLYVNLDGISLVGAIPTEGAAPTVEMIPPTFVYTTKPFRVRVNLSDAVGAPQVKLFDEDKLIASQTHAVGPLTKQIDFLWTPLFTGTRTLKVEVTNALGKTTTITQSVKVVPIVEFLANGDFEGGFRSDGVALKWEWFNNGGRNVIHQLYDDTWAPVVSSGKHSQLIEISTIGHGEHDPYQEADRFAGICQIVSGLTPNASYYLSAQGVLRVSEFEKVEQLDDWSYAAQWGYLIGADPACARWNDVDNWQVIPWGHTDYRESPTKMNSFSTVLFAPAETLTIYLRGWKKWAFGNREFLLNLDDVSFAGYKEPPVPTTTITPTATLTPTVTPGK